MNYYYIMRSLLFQGLTRNEVEAFLEQIGAQERTYKQGERIFRVGKTGSSIGFVLSGSVRMEHTDVWGGSSIISIALAGKTFAEAQACLGDHALVVEYFAHEDCEILMLDANELMHPDKMGISAYQVVSSNLTKLIALRNLELARHAFIVSAKTTREKVLLYLSLQATEQGEMTFEIPYNREQLARYLGVDRSALSGTLSRMRAAGEIDFRKNRFTIYERVPE